jgi:hypothetical protein
MNGAVFESDIAEAAAFSPFVWKRLRWFLRSGVRYLRSGVGSSAAGSLKTLLSGAAI